MGRTLKYGKMVTQFVEGIDPLAAPVKPKTPRKASVKDEDIPFELTKYESELARYYKNKENYDDTKNNNNKVYVIVWGQCTLTMKNKVRASVSDYNKIKADGDVVQLVSVLKELSFSTLNAHYEYWTMMESRKALLNVRQVSMRVLPHNTEGGETPGTSQRK